MSNKTNFAQIETIGDGNMSIIRRIKWDDTTCAWCGQTRKDGSLFNYGTLSPSLKQDWQRKLFCSIGCMRTYNQ